MSRSQSRSQTGRSQRQNVAVRDQIIEEGNATMVFQNMGRAQLFKGRAQCLSSDEFQQTADEIEARKMAKAASKEANKVARQRRKKLKEEMEKEWVRMKQCHAAEVELWSLRCSDLLAGGSKKKDLPPKPKLGRKPQVPAVDDDEEDEEEEPIEEDDV